MQSSKTYSKNRYAICVYGILLTSAILPALLAVNHIRISPDSMIYSLISQEILSGNGISWPILYDLKDNFIFMEGATPYLGQPPLLPILFAILGGVTSQNYLPAQAINVISHMAISVFAFLLMKKIYDNNGIALLTGILVSFSTPLLWNTHLMLSESLFIALTIAAVYFLILSRYSDSFRSNRNLFVASICASAAILTRFAGIVLIPVLFFETFILVRNKNFKSRIVSTLLTTMLPVITVGALFIRNYMISGTILGWNPPSPDRSYLSAFTGTLKMMFLQFHLNELHILLITIFVIPLILYIIVNAITRRELSKQLNSGLDLIIVFIIIHTLLISHAMAKSQTVFELRYMSPLVPFLLILCNLLIVTVSEMIQNKGYYKLSVCGILLFFGIITFGIFYKTYMNSGMLFSKQPGHYRILNSPTYSWLKNNYGENVIITSNRPFHLSFFGGYSTIRLPHRRFNENYRIPDNMESFLPNSMSKYGSQVLALFEEADEQYEGSYIAGLFNIRENDNNFVVAHKFSDGVVYNLKE